MQITNIILIFVQYGFLLAIYNHGVLKVPKYQIPRDIYTKEYTGIVPRFHRFNKHNIIIGRNSPASFGIHNNIHGFYINGYGAIYAPSAVQLPMPVGPAAPMHFGWNQQRNHLGSTDSVKPVTEEQPDDFKYDFRTKTHSIR
ncbi:uncharacterized protein LOC115887350 [Sitophilus oryzae]|uniref:Uncharacterized protein LOC115887350 n=1 Tax=Sitophilus oryzae TaxID=7048 RepID=A0A6J2YHN5_SITOR|nr:uncharacterized protein LOC115887350 [Sitophilus oryzae]